MKRLGVIVSLLLLIISLVVSGCGGDVYVPPTPAMFSVSNLSIGSTEVELNELVNISVLVSNTGGSQGSYNIALNINGEQEATKVANIAAGGSETVQFSVMKANPGTYGVSVNGLSGSFAAVYMIPSDFTTATEPTHLYSISYPNDWEAPLYLLEDLGQKMENLRAAVAAEMPLDRYSMIFLAGVPSQLGWWPNVNIGVESLSISNITHELMVEAEMQGVVILSDDYVLHNRIDTVIDGRPATIVDWEGTFQQFYRTHTYTMYTLVGEIAWIITCTPPVGEFSEWEEIFNDIVRSLQIYT